MLTKLQNCFTKDRCTNAGRKVFVPMITALMLAFTLNVYGQLKINDLEYFETDGVNVLVYSNEYNGIFFDEKTAGIEIIHHGVRTATGGAVRLQNTPEQWDLIPKMTKRNVDPSTNTIDVELRYEDYDFNSRISVTAKDKGVVISVFLDKPLPKELEGRAGMNMEFLPASYFEHNYLVDGNPGIFPKYPSSNTEVKPISEKLPQFGGHSTFDDRGKGEFIVPKPIAKGKKFAFAPEDPERFVKLESEDEIMLFDGRNLAQNGWFIVRTMLPAGKTGKVVEWYLEPNSIQGWKREPVIGFSQVGYVPQQEKVAVIELDRHYAPPPSASLLKINEDGQYEEVFKGRAIVWGQYLRYNYVKFDFSSVKEPGIYCIQYGDQKSNTFPIGPNVYDEVWHPTLDVWFPVQMDHMNVNEAYRTWHGAPYMDDCLQAPLNHQHFDGYRQGPTTDTKYKPLEHIPGMTVGGWFDAGDFDIQTGSHNSVITTFVDAWEFFKVDRDQTYIDQSTKYVDIHRPDGQPDVLQQIEHGVLNLVAQVENIGHPVRGIIVPNLHQYHHLGDAMTETDNLPYNPNLKPYESDGLTSGTLDDRWAFTNRLSFLDYQTGATFAAASRAMKGYNDELSEKCLKYAVKLLNEADEAMKKPQPNNGEPWMRRMGQGADLETVLQLYITTKEKQYLDRYLKGIWPMLDESTSGNNEMLFMFMADRSMSTALKALPHMDEKYKKKLKEYVIKYNETNKRLEFDNPYSVPMSKRKGWGGTSSIINWSIAHYYAHLAYPDIIGTENIYKGLGFLFGCHPYSNVSFINAVGTKTKKVAYGNNRADFTAIAGGVIPGLIKLDPDYLENKDDWPFFWGQNECIIDGGAWYIFLGNAVNKIVEEGK